MNVIAVTIRGWDILECVVTQIQEQSKIDEESKARNLTGWHKYI